MTSSRCMIILEIKLLFAKFDAEKMMLKFIMLLVRSSQ